MNQNKTARYEWVDIAKFIGLFLMILGHKELLDTRSTNVIFSFHMPLFFILSGMLHKDYDFKTALRKVWYSLLRPFLIIAASWCLIFTLLNLRHEHDTESVRWLIGHFAGTFICPGKTFMSYDSICCYIWFLLALALIKLIASMVKEKKQWLIAPFVSLAIFIVIYQNSIVLPLAIDSALLAFPFYAIGYGLNEVLLYKKYNKVLCWTIPILLFVITITISKQNGIVDINNCRFGNNILYFYLFGTIGTLAVIGFSKLFVSKPSFITRLGGVIVDGALLIVGYSAYLTGIIRDSIPCLPHNNIGGFIIGVLVMCVLYIPILAAQKYFPEILGKKRM